MVKKQFIRTVRKSGTSLAINLPVEIVKLLKLKEGEMVKVEVEKIES